MFNAIFLVRIPSKKNCSLFGIIYCNSKSVYYFFLLKILVFSLIPSPLTLVGDRAICLPFSDSAISEL